MKQIVSLAAAAVLLILGIPFCAAAVEPAASAAEVWFVLPEAAVGEKGDARLEWNYVFLRGNRHDRVFNADQSVTATRSNHRKTHLVTWRLAYGLTDWLQPEAEILYKAYRQHTHGNDDIHDRNDDGDFERIFAGASVQWLRESDALPNLRLRAGFLLPKRAETEDIGQEAGFSLLAASSKAAGDVRISASAGLAMTFNNHDHPADPVFEDRTPISKGHDLRAFTYGLGVAYPFAHGWQAHLELDGKVYDSIQLNRRIHRSELSLTPGVLFRKIFSRWEGWLGIGLPIGIVRDPESLIHNTDAIGVSIKTGMVF